jgi:hypothetical protein
MALLEVRVFLVLSRFQLGMLYNAILHASVIALQACVGLSRRLAGLFDFA